MSTLRQLLRVGIAAVVLLAIATLLTNNSITSAANTKSTAPTRGYYLARGTNLFTGGQALTACVTGYHMASLWEIHEPSNLRYDTALGITQDDSGSGPPSSSPGWIRTGFATNTSGGLGSQNCAAWTSSSSSDQGTLVSLDSAWNSGATVSPITPWAALGETCDILAPVWCVQD
jgi:hypothetical protein